MLDFFATRRSCVLVAAVCALAGCDRAAPAGRAAAAERALPSDAELRELIDEVLDFTQNERRLSADVHAAWQILHGVLAFGPEFEIDDHQGRRVKAVEWVLAGGDLNGWTMEKGSVGLRAVMEPGSKTGQGHPDQWLAVLSQCGLGSNQPVLVGGREYTIGQLVDEARWDIYEGKECSWTLIGLSSYLPLDATWAASDGGEWSIERMVAMEAGPVGLAAGDLAPHITDSACGGSHRLIGLAMTLDRYRQKHPDAELAGGWLAAHENVSRAIDAAQRFQQPSGAFSVNYFSRPSNSPDLAVHLGSTGHTIEFLVLALDSLDQNERLGEPWIKRGVAHLCELFERTRSIDLECGALYHAAHGLALYRERRFGAREAEVLPAASAEKVGEQ